MSNVYVLGSINNQGKTTTALLLEKMLRGKGQKVACLQRIKGQYDVGMYLKNGCYHYSIPVEASKSRDTFERWMPQGYDSYIIEITMAFSPLGAAFLDIFHSYNEIISFDLQDCWREHLEKFHHADEQNREPIRFWEAAQKKKVQKVITKTPHPLDEPCVSKDFVLHHSEKFLFDNLEPKMTFPTSKKKAIAFGAFPGEYWDIYPNLKWFKYDACSFQHELMKEPDAIAIIGGCKNQDLKFKYKPSATNVVCYQPPVFQSDVYVIPSIPQFTNLQQIFKSVKEKPVGDSLGGNPGTKYAAFDNRFWVWQVYSGDEIVYKNRNIVYCNGWILPQYLIKEGLLEV